MIAYKMKSEIGQMEERRKTADIKTNKRLHPAV